MGKNSNYRATNKGSKGSNPNPPGRGGRGRGQGGRGKAPHRGGNFQPIGGKSGQESRRDRSPSRSPSRHGHRPEERSDSRRSDSRSSHHSGHSSSSRRSGNWKDKVWVNPSLAAVTTEPSTARGETTGASSDVISREKSATNAAKKNATSAAKSVVTTESSTAKGATTGASPTTTSTTSTSATATSGASSYTIPKLDPKRKRSGDRSREEGHEAKKRKEKAVRPELRQLPLVKRGDLEKLKIELAKEKEVNNLDRMDEDEAVKYGYLFYHVEEHIIAFAHPSGKVFIGKTLPRFLKDDLLDADIVKIGNIKDKYHLEGVLQMEIRNQFDPEPLIHTHIDDIFDDELEIDNTEKDQTRYLKRKAIRNLKNKIWQFWEFVQARTTDLPNAANLLVWAHLAFAEFSELKGRSAGYTKAVDVSTVAKKMDESPYYRIEFDLPISEKIPDSIFKVHALTKDDAYPPGAPRIERRRNFLKNEKRCGYPLCELPTHSTQDCPSLLGWWCPLCKHRGHNETHHALHDQLIFDNLYLIFAPSHNILGRIWMEESSEITEEDWIKSYVRKEWTAKASAITGLPKPAPAPRSVMLELQNEADFQSKRDKLIADFQARAEAIKAVRDQEKAMAESKRLAEEKIAEIKAAKEAEATKAAEAKMDVDKTDTANLPTTDQVKKAAPKEIPLMDYDDEARLEQLEQEEEAYQLEKKKERLQYLERKKAERESSKKPSKKKKQIQTVKKFLDAPPKPKVTIDQITEGATAIVTQMFQTPTQKTIPIPEPINPEEAHDEQMSDVTITYDFQTNA